MERLEPVAKLYCYRTLGNVECFDVPQAGMEDRLVGVTPTITPITDKEKESWQYILRQQLKRVNRVMNGDIINPTLNSSEEKDK